MTDQDTPPGTSATDIPAEITRAALAAGLRRITGNLSQREVARATGVPEATLSGTFRAQTLPSPETVARLVTPFGGDTEGWVAYRNQIAQAELNPRSADTATSDSLSDRSSAFEAQASDDSSRADENGEASPVVHPEPRFRKRTLVIATAAALIVGAGAGAGGTLLVTDGSPASSSPPAPSAAGGDGADADGAGVSVKTGDNPAVKPECMNDAVTAAASQHGKLYLMELR